MRNGFLQAEINRRFGFNVSKWVVFHGMKLAREIFNGDRGEEFVMAREYAETLMVHNPGSIVVMHVDSVPNPVRPRFERMHVCLEACVNDFRNGCKTFIGLDGFYEGSGWWTFTFHRFGRF